PGRAGWPVGDPVGHRPVRVRRPEPAAQLGDGVGLLPVHHLDVEGPWRLDAARLPGVQGRAGPPRRAALGRRARREQLGLRRARRRHLTPLRRTCARSRSSGNTPSVNRNCIVALVLAIALAAAGGPAIATAAGPGPYVALGDSYTAAPLVP